MPRTDLPGHRPTSRPAPAWRHRSRSLPRSTPSLYRRTLPTRHLPGPASVGDSRESSVHARLIGPSVICGPSGIVECRLGLRDVVPGFLHGRSLSGVRSWTPRPLVRARAEFVRGVTQETESIAAHPFERRQVHGYTSGSSDMLTVGWVYLVEYSSNSAILGSAPGGKPWEVNPAPLRTVSGRVSRISRRDVIAPYHRRTDPVSPLTACR